MHILKPHASQYIIPKPYALSTLCRWRRQAWVVTGTPISNDLSEVHGLLLFLDEQPYSMVRAHLYPTQNAL